MKYDEFIGQVRSRAGLQNREEAVLAAQATLTVLGRRLFGGEAENLAAQLPHELQDCLQQEQSEKFDLDEFFERISEEEGVGLDEAVEHARAVCSVLSDAVTPGEMEDVLSQLPGKFTQLFHRGGEEPSKH